MAVYKHHDFLQQSSHQAFDTALAAGDISVYTGIFRCTVCGREVIARTGETLPDASHHVHAGGVDMRWQLVVSID